MLKRILIIATAFFIFNSNLAQPPKNAVIVYNQGITFMNKEKYPDAMASFFKAIKLYKNYDSAYFQMANINLKFRSIDTAISFYKKALEINPKFLPAAFSLAFIYRNTKNDVGTSLAYYLKALSIDTANKEAMIGAAWCYNTKQQYDLAISYAVKALAIDNNDRGAYGELGHAIHLSGKFQEGIAQFKKNIAVSPHELPMYYCGLCYIELKDKAGALSMYDELKKISSNMADALKKRIDKM